MEIEPLPKDTELSRALCGGFFKEAVEVGHIMIMQISVGNSLY